MDSGHASGFSHRHVTSSPLGAAIPPTGGSHRHCVNSSIPSGACGTTGTPAFAVPRVLLRLLSTLLLTIAFPQSSVWAALASLPRLIGFSHLLLPWLAFLGCPLWRNDAGSSMCGWVGNVLLRPLLSCLNGVGINALSRLTFNRDGLVDSRFRPLLSLRSLSLPHALARCFLHALSRLFHAPLGSKIATLCDQQCPIRALPSHDCPHKFQFQTCFFRVFLGPIPQHGLLGAPSLQDVFATAHKFHYFQFQTVLNSTTMSLSKLPHAISSIVNHLWLVFQPILVAFLAKSSRYGQPQQ